ncbi:hypothetical protein ACJX0J_017298, partial [Zea mays]
MDRALFPELIHANCLCVAHELMGSLQTRLGFNQIRFGGLISCIWVADVWDRCEFGNSFLEMKSYNIEILNIMFGTGVVLRSPDVAGQRAQGLLRHRRGRCSSRRQQPSWRTLRWVVEEEESEGGRRGCLAEARGEGERHLQGHNLGETATTSVPHDRHQDLKLAIDDFDEELIDPELRFSFQRNNKVCGVDLTDKVVDIIFHVFDANCDGNLSSEEFLRKCLFSMMSDLPSVLEAFVDRKHNKDREEKMAMPRVPGQHLLPPMISIYPLKSIFWRTEAIQVE